MAKRELAREPRPEKRCMLFNENGSKIFTGDDAIAEAIENGYQDTPLPATQTAQEPGGSDSEMQEKLDKMNQALAEQSKQLAEANRRADEAEKAAEAVTEEVVQTDESANDTETTGDEVEQDIEPESEEAEEDAG